MSTPLSKRVLNVAENETAARSMAHILAGTQQERVVREFNRVSRTWSYCFSYKNVDINGELPCDMVFTYCNGHLLNHEFERDWIDWDSCKPSELFDKPVEKVIKAVREYYNFLFSSFYFNVKFVKRVVVLLLT